MTMMTVETSSSRQAALLLPTMTMMAVMFGSRQAALLLPTMTTTAVTCSSPDYNQKLSSTSPWNNRDFPGAEW
jgi:hypothetical protein